MLCLARISSLRFLHLFGDEGGGGGAGQAALSTYYIQTLPYTCIQINAYF